MCTPRNLKLLNLSTVARRCGWGCALSVLSALPFSSVDHDLLLCFVDIEGAVMILAPLHQGSQLLPVGCFCLITGLKNGYELKITVCQWKAEL
jgi:hypothetical protein